MSCNHSSNWRRRELFPHAVDRLAREQPHAPYGRWPVAQTSYDAGFRTIDYAQLANLVNGLAWWLKKNMTPARDAPQVLAYIGPNDVRITATLLASIKAGYGLFLPSPRNSTTAQRSLLKALDCHTLITTDPTPQPATSLLENLNPPPFHLTIPSIDELLAKQHPVFAYNKSYEEGRWDPLFIIHSSGSTGVPKPKIWTQEAGLRHILSSAQDHKLQPGAKSIEELLQGTRIIVTLPLFHGAGLAMYLFYAVGFGTVPIAPAAQGIVTAQGLVDALEQTPAEVAFLVPSVVLELAQNPEILARCSKYLEAIIYAGGDLPQALGDRVASVIPLRCWWGSIETGLPQQLLPPGLGLQDWRYFRFHPSVGATYEKVAENSYELVIQHDQTLEHAQVAFSIRGQETYNHYRTKDLFEPHLTVLDAWCWRARRDDIIVFLNGEKTNPVSMEQHIVASNPEVASAIVVGTQRFQAALLIEAADSIGSLETSSRAGLVERIWPSVQEAKKATPGYARVEKALILILPADRPVIRAGKGTIQRAASIAQYAAEIDKLYNDADVIDGDHDSDHAAVGPMMNLADEDSIGRFVKESVKSVTGWSISETEAQIGKKKNGSHESFFDRGMDSFMALQLLRSLRRGFNHPDLGLSTIYSNPTVAGLIAALMAQTNGGGGANDEPTPLMEALLANHQEIIQQIPKPNSILSACGAQDRPVTTILTGSTGRIGTYLLRALLDRPEIEHIICLNRSQDGGRASQKARLADAGLDVDAKLLDQRVSFLHADLSQPFLGLGEAVYVDLRIRVGLIIHNAWPVNFNLGLMAFEPQLAGLVNLFRLAAESSLSQAPRIVFISSIGAVGGLAAKGQPVPEELLTSFTTPSSSGYAQSKFLAELLCDASVRQLGLPSTVIRVGQVAGSIRQPGEWNRNEAIPSLLIASAEIAYLSEDIGMFSEIDWIPVDLLSDMLIDLALSNSDLNTGPGSLNAEHHQDGVKVFNLRNPHTTTWQALLPSIVQAIQSMPVGSEHAPVILPPSVWLAKLSENDCKVGGNGAKQQSNAAAKLLDFYRNQLWAMGNDAPEKAIQPMKIEKSLAQSAALRGLQVVARLDRLAALMKSLSSSAVPFWEHHPVTSKEDRQIVYAGLGPTTTLRSELQKALWSDVKIAQLDDEPPEIAPSLLHEPFVQLYISLGGILDKRMYNVEQSRRMLNLRIKIDVWSKGLEIPEDLREFGRERLLDAYLALPPVRMWLYSKRLRRMLSGHGLGLLGDYESSDLDMDVIGLCDKPEDIIAAGLLKSMVSVCSTPSVGDLRSYPYEFGFMFGDTIRQARQL